MITALIPAILYYLAVWINVHLEALKLGLVGLPKDQLPSAKVELSKSGHLLLPIVLLLYLLLADYTPSYSAFYSILCLVVVSFFKKHTRMNIKSLVVAHMFVLYYAVLSAITPPVALAAYAGAGLANAPPSQVGWTAVRLGLAGFIVPFMFVFSPALAAQSDSLLEIFRCFATATIGIYCLACSIQGYMMKEAGYLERAILFCSALLLIDGGVITDAIGFSLLAIVWFKQKASKKSAIPPLSS